MMMSFMDGPVYYIFLLTQMEIQIATSLSMQPHGSKTSATSFRSYDVAWAKACPILIFDLI